MKKLIMMVVLMPLMALAYEKWTDPNTGIEWTYSVQNDGSVSLGGENLEYITTAITEGTSGTLIIPSIINGRSVTRIGRGAFLRCSGLTLVTIPEGVTSIDDDAFSGCCGLMSVTIPPSVLSIGPDAFFNCSGLTAVTIPPSVTSVGEYAFHECNGLTAVNINDLVAWCGIEFASTSANPLCYAKKLFLNGAEIIDLVVPKGVKKIGALLQS